MVVYVHVATWALLLCLRCGFPATTKTEKLFYCRVYLFACLFRLFSFIFVFQGCPLLSLHPPQRERETKRERDGERPFEGEMRIEIGCCWNVKERRWSKSIYLWSHGTERTENRSKMGAKWWKVLRDQGRERGRDGEKVRAAKIQDQKYMIRV